MPSTGNIFDVTKGDENDGRFCIGVLRCSAEVEEKSQANEGCSGRGLSPTTPEICADHTEATGQINSCLCVRQLRENGQIEVPGQKQRIDAEMRLIFRSSTFTTLDPADDPRFA